MARTRRRQGIAVDIKPFAREFLAPSSRGGRQEILRALETAAHRLTQQAYGVNATAVTVWTAFQVPSRDGYTSRVLLEAESVKGSIETNTAELRIGKEGPRVILHPILRSPY